MKTLSVFLISLFAVHRVLFVSIATEARPLLMLESCSSSSYMKTGFGRKSRSPPPPPPRHSPGPTPKLKSPPTPFMVIGSTPRTSPPPPPSSSPGPTPKRTSPPATSQHSLPPNHLVFEKSPPNPYVVSA